MRRAGTALGSIQALAIVALASCCVALAAEIPAIIQGTHELVAVEPLLRDLDMGYDIRGVTLTVSGRVYPNPLVVRDGMSMADAGNFARFLHLNVAKRDGVLVFSQNAADGLAPASPPSASDVDEVRTRLLDLLNQHRGDAGVDPLQMDPTAQTAAQYQADDMSSAGVMRHEDSTGRTPMERFVAFGGHAAWYGENVGWYQTDPSDATGMWSVVSKLDGDMMAEQPPDDGHREAILNPKYEGVGIGIAVGPDGLYLAEDFVGR